MRPSDHPLSFGVLGPLEIRDRDGPCRISGEKQRALLALLLLHRGETLSTDAIVEELWDGDPPPTAVKAVQVHVSRLRKALGDGVIETHGHGYRIDPEPETLDLERFESLVAEGRTAASAGDARRAADALRRALALWRGPPLADLAYEPFAAPEIARLEALRLSVVEDRIDADLALGEGADLTAELTVLTEQHPLRERLRAQLMVALYRAGRQADALACYAETRRVLDEQLGLTPSPQLREVEHAILVQDTALEGARQRGPRRVLGPGGRVRGHWLVQSGLVLLALAALAITLIDRAGGAHSRALVRADSVAALDPQSRRVVSAVAVPGATRLAVAGRRLWIASEASRLLQPLDARSGVREPPVRLDGGPADIAAGAGLVWALDRLTGTLVEVSDRGGRVTRRIRLLDAGAGFADRDRFALSRWSVAAAASGAWVTDGSSRVQRIEASGRIRRFDVGDPVDGIAISGKAAWAISGPGAAVLRIALGTGAVTARIPIVSRPAVGSPYPIAVQAGPGGVWVLNANTDTLTRIDPKLRGVTATIAIGAGRTPLRLALSRDAAWVAGADGTLTRVDARTNARRVLLVASGVLDVAVAGDRVWFATGRALGR